MFPNSLKVDTFLFKLSEGCLIRGFIQALRELANQRVDVVLSSLFQTAISVQAASHQAYLNHSLSSVQPQPGPACSYKNILKQIAHKAPYLIKCAPEILHARHI